MIQEVWNRKHAEGRKVMLFSLLAALLLFVINLSIGSASISLSEILNVLLGRSTDTIASAIIIDFRVPRTLTAIAAGIALSLSGLQMQTLFRNPLAGPFVLGISSGASMGVALLVMGTSGLSLVLTGVSTAIAAFVGSLSVLMVILLLSRKLKDTSSLLILGLMFGSAVGAGISLLQYFSKPEQIQGFLFWTFGSLTGVTWSELYLMLPTVGVGLVAVLVLSKPLNLLILGEDYAISSGVNIQKTRLVIIIITSLLTGVTTAFCGPIAFIGIAIPHIARLVFNTANHQLLVPIVALMGAVIMMICDIISQLPGYSQTIPINVVTSIFGAPLIIWLILRRKKLASF